MTTTEYNTCTALQYRIAHMQQKSCPLPAAVLPPLLVLCAWMLSHVHCTACPCGLTHIRKRNQIGSLHSCCRRPVRQRRLLTPCRLLWSAWRHSKREQQRLQQFLHVCCSCGIVALDHNRCCRRRLADSDLWSGNSRQGGVVGSAERGMVCNRPVDCRMATCGGGSHPPRMLRSCCRAPAPAHAPRCPPPGHGRGSGRVRRSPRGAWQSWPRWPGQCAP